MKRMGLVFLWTFGASLTLTNLALAEEIHLVKGATNLFSEGFDTLNDRLKDRGFNSYVHLNGTGSIVASNIIKRAKMGKVSYPIILIGHSAGGVEVVAAANKLSSNGIETRLLIGVDPGFLPPARIKNGVVEVVNYKVNHPLTYKLKGVSGYKGDIKNQNVNKISGGEKVGHTSIDNSVFVQDLIIKDIRKAVD